MDRYVCGFAFNKYGGVLLVHKKHGPPPVVGRWNGVGGKIELGETPLGAMRREFQEETGVAIQDWKMKLHLKHKHDGFQVFFGYGAWPEDLAPHTVMRFNDAGEPLRWWPPNAKELRALVVPNLLWVLPLMMDNDIVSAEAVDCVTQ